MGTNQPDSSSMFVGCMPVRLQMSMVTPPVRLNSLCTMPQMTTVEMKWGI